MKKGIVLILLLAFCIVSLCACNAAEQYFVYGTILEVDASGVGAVKLAKKISTYIGELEPVLSPTVEGSDIYRINCAAAGERIECSSATMDILQVAERVYVASGGAYDPSVYPLVKLWKFSGDTYSFIDAEQVPPSESEIAEVKAVCGLSKAFDIDYVNSTVTKKEGYDDAMLDLGGVAKGYSVDKSIELVSDKQKALINLGGNIGAANKSYTVGIGNPRESATAYFGSFTLNDGECISTSGDYERYYYYNNVRYHHILDPKTGSPCDSGLISVSVVCSDGALGDAVSTAVMVLGLTDGQALMKTLGLKGVIISSDLSFVVVGDLEFVKK